MKLLIDNNIIDITHIAAITKIVTVVGNHYEGVIKFDILFIGSSNVITIMRPYEDPSYLSAKSEERANKIIKENLKHTNNLLKMRTRLMEYWDRCRKPLYIDITEK